MRTTVLDHGYIEKVETWGSDERIIESARMSTSKGFLGWGPKCVVCGRSYGSPSDPVATTIPAVGCLCGSREQGPGDEKLLRFLHENKHSTPFEFAGLSVEVQAPIMVFREWHRHRVPFGYSEQSARYVEMPELFYVPSAERLGAGGQSRTNKQASGTVLDAETVDFAQDAIRTQCAGAFETYRALIRNGVAREIARLVLPVNTYSRMRATGNLRGWLGFLTLRTAPNAQWEIRQYANELGVIVAEAFPRTWELFAEGQRK